MPQKRHKSADENLQENGQSDSKKKKVEESLFGEVLSEAGFILNFSNEPYTLGEYFMNDIFCQVVFS